MSDSIATNVGLLRDFQTNTATKDLPLYTAEYLCRLKALLECNENNPSEFSEAFSDAEIREHRDHGKPLPGGRSERYWKRHAGWTETAILGRQRYYIKAKLLPSARRKMLEMLTGRNYSQIADEIGAEEKSILNSMRSWLETERAKHQKEQTEDQK